MNSKSVHIVADASAKLSALRSMLAPHHAVTCDFLGGATALPGACDVLVVTANLQSGECIAALKEMFDNLRHVPKRIFLVDRKSRLSVAQAYALGATHVFINPSNQKDLLAVLTGSVHSAAVPIEPVNGAHAAGIVAATAVTSMFSAAVSGAPIDIGGVKSAGSEIANSIAEDGLSNWLEMVRRHHEGTFQHCLLVTGIAVDFGLSLGLAKPDIERLYSAAMFHDIGKAKIPLAILDKSGHLDARERALIETHPVAGFDILKANAGISAEVLDAVRHHHEYLDGSGYPDALCAPSISDIVRILTISDIFAALIEHRRYKPTMSREQAYGIIQGMRGRLEGPLMAAFRDVALNR